MTFTSLHGPRNKFDHASIAYLDTLPVYYWRHLIWDILDWLGDSNWPIFIAVRDLLLKNPHDCVPQLRHVFEGNDAELQYNCLCHLIPHMPEEYVRALAPDLRQYRDAVSDEVDQDYEMRESVDEVLQDISENVEDVPV
jgi:hypothetical protein